MDLENPSCLFLLAQATEVKRFETTAKHHTIKSYGTSLKNCTSFLV